MLEPLALPLASYDDDEDCASCSDATNCFRISAMEFPEAPLLAVEDEPSEGGGPGGGPPCAPPERCAKVALKTPCSSVA